MPATSPTDRSLRPATEGDLTEHGAPGPDGPAAILGPEVPWPPDRVRKYVSFWLLTLLTALIVVYVVAVIMGLPEAALTAIMAAVAVVSGMASSAVTYYFTKM